jgi:nucleoid-associated protein YgaU
MAVHKVKSGDTLSKIALEYYHDAQAWQIISEANGITNPTSLRINQEIKIPWPPATTAPAATGGEAAAGGDTVTAPN